MPKEFKIEDKVLPFIKYIKKKLDHQQLNPFKIVRKTKGNEIYKLELLKLYLIHPIIYISLLKLYQRRDSIEPPPPSKINRGLKQNIKYILG